MTRITRVGFCSYCAKEHRPKTNQAFVAIGATNDYHIYFALHNGIEGYVPHLYELKKVIGENVVYRKMCAMNGCALKVNLQTGEFFLPDDYWERGIMTITQWNGLVLFKDTGYKI